MKPEQIGSRIKQWRKHLNLTQVGFAELSGVHIGVLKKYERGVNVPGGEALGAFSKTGVNVNWLLTGEGHMTDTPSPEAASDNELPQDLQEFEEGIQEMFRLLIEMEEPRRGIAVSEIVNKVKEAAMVDQMAKKLRELEQEK